MRIKSLRVERYGPLEGFPEREIGDFTLVRGPNEEGKTLIIDALLRLLFRKGLGRVKGLGNVTRVEEAPEGYVIVEIDGEEKKIGRDDSLTKHTSITANDFRNIFVVRDSDLSIVDEGSYFTDVSEKLAGLRTSEINRIKKTLQSKGNLTNSTSNADLANNVESGHIRRRVELAREFIKEIDTLIEDLEKTDFERLEQLLGEAREGLGRERGELAAIEKARVRDECLENGKRLAELKGILGALRDLGPVNDNDLATWAHGVRDLKRLHAELEDIRHEHSHYQVQIAELEDSVSQRTAALDAMVERSRRVEDLLDPKIAAVQNATETLARAETKAGWNRWTAVVASIGLIVSLVGTVLQPNVFLFSFDVLFFVIAILAGVRVFLVRSYQGKMKQHVVELKSQAASLGFEASSMEDLLRAKAELERDIDEARRVTDGIRVSVGANQKHFEATGRRMRDIRQEIDTIEQSLSELKLRSGVVEIEDYHRALRAKTDHAAQKRYLTAMLSQTLGGEDEDDPVEFWRRKIEGSLAEIGNGSVEYDPQREAQLRGSIASLETDVRSTEEELKNGRQALRDFESKVRGSQITGSEDAVCRTSGELRALGRRLDQFVGSVMERRDDVRLALEILEEIEAEEKTRVVELFGMGSSVSAYFKRITGGKYVEVSFDPEEVRLSVRTPAGQWIDADKLSGGTHDQLYLVIRLSIAERMLGDDRGFFILDDPFVKSDIGRLKNQLQLLKSMAGAGWQILYFSAKKEVYDLLKTDVSAGLVQLIDLDGEPARPSVLPPGPSPSADLFSDGTTY